MPSPFPSSTVTLFDVEFAITRSSVAKATPLLFVAVFPSVPAAMAIGPVSVFARTMGEFVAAVKFPPP